MSVKPLIRRRGVILTAQGQQKLDIARRELEQQINNGHRFTLEELCDRAYLSVKTVTKILDGQTAVDRQTLDTFFSAFGLTLEKSDYSHPQADSSLPIAETRVPETPIPPSHIDWGEAPDVSNFVGRQAELS
ncbi:MAG: hypothetical protein ABEI32_15250, partial [Halothece sp.]